MENGSEPDLTTSNGPEPNPATAKECMSIIEKVQNGSLERVEAIIDLARLVPKHNGALRRYLEMVDEAFDVRQPDKGGPIPDLRRDEDDQGDRRGNEEDNANARDEEWVQKSIRQSVSPEPGAGVVYPWTK